MTTTIQSTELRRQVRTILNRVQQEEEPVIVQTYNTAQAVLIPYQDFAAYQAWRAQRRKREVWLAELRTIAAEVSSQVTLSADEVDTLLSEAAKESQRVKTSGE